MLKIFLILLFIFFGTVSCFSQENNDSIVIKKTKTGIKYFYKEKEINRSFVCFKLEANSFSNNYMSISKEQRNLGRLILIAGAYPTCLSFGTITGAIIFKEIKITKNDYLLALLSIVIDWAGMNLLSESRFNFKQAINSYNRNLNNKSTGYDNEINFQNKLNIISLIYDF